VNGELRLVDDVAIAFAELVVEQWQKRSGELFSMALSGGPTARRCYERLAELGSESIDWWAVDIFFGDERCVPGDDPASNQRLVREALLERVGGANSVHPMDCEAGADAYQLEIGDIGTLDLVHLGLGPDGHTASLFSGSPALESEPGRLVAMNHDPSGRNPHQRMTLTLAGIARSRLVVFTVAGEEKREALAQVLAGADLPATRVAAPSILWLVDAAALGRPTL
jgi:6-phosphogluconolactonase